MTILYILLKLTNTENEGHHHLLWLAILLPIRMCLCYSLVLQIQGQKEKQTKQVKTKEFRWGGGRDLPTDFNRNLMDFIEFWGKKKSKYFVLLLLHVKTAPGAHLYGWRTEGCHPDRGPAGVSWWDRPRARKQLLESVRLSSLRLYDLGGRSPTPDKD